MTVAFKRADGVYDGVNVIRTHRSAPFKRNTCCPDHATPCGADAPEKHFPRPVDMHQLRRAFPERWGEFCRTHFRDAEHLAVFMGCDERTARYWLESKHAPAAPFVIRAVTAFPDAVDCLMEGDC